MEYVSYIISKQCFFEFSFAINVTFWMELKEVS